MRVAVMMVILSASVAWGATWREGASDGFGPGQAKGTAVTDSVLRLDAFVGLNMGLDAHAVSGSNSLTGSRSVTDGDTDTEWRFNNRTDVLGLTLTLDLGGDRAIDRIRLAPGDLLEQRPLFFLKGYRLEISTQVDPGGWILAAVQADNRLPLVDTTADSTWQDTDGDGTPQPVVGRFVRLTVSREDPPNWVSIGEFEVYGDGFRVEGSYESAIFDAGRPVDFGAVRFAGAASSATSLTLQARTSTDGVDWVDWRDLPVWTFEDTVNGLQMAGAEPAQFAQYRVDLATRDPRQTPLLTGVEIDFDSLLAASRVTGSIQPRRPPLGVETAFFYQLDVEVAPEDTGFDRVEIELPGVVDEVRWQGAALPTDAYAAAWDATGLSMVLAPDWRIVTTGRLEIDFTGVLLQPTQVVRVAVARDGEANLLFAGEGEAGWTLEGVGVQRGVLSNGGVRVHPNPFNPRGGPTVIEIDVAKLQVPQPVSVRVLDLSGRRVNLLWDRREVTAGRHRVEWDGRVDGGGLTPPGIYVLEVSVDADRGGHWLGTIAVVY